MLLADYFRWWYTSGLVAFYKWWKDLLGFIIYYFSIKDLFKTLFDPWKRDTVNYGKSLEAIFKNLTDSLISRLMGFTVRIIVILIGLLLEIFILLLSFVSLVIWLGLFPFCILLITVSLK